MEGRWMVTATDGCWCGLTVAVMMVVGVESFFPIMGGFPGNFQLMFPFQNFHGRQDNPCIKNPCEGGLLCFVDKKPPYYTCSKCPPGYEGDGIICYRPVEDPCASQPCYPGVSCTIQVGPPRTYKCGDCPSDLVGDGKICVENPCDNQPCTAAVSCSVRESPPFIYKCGECPPDHLGDGRTCAERSTSPCSGCPIGFNGTKQECFDTYKDLHYDVRYPDGDYMVFTVKEKTTWSEARRLCQDMGGDLSTISHDKYDIFLSITGEIGRRHRLETPYGFWLGASKTENGNWTWHTGTPAYINFGDTHCGDRCLGIYDYYDRINYENLPCSTTYAYPFCRTLNYTEVCT